MKCAVIAKPGCELDLKTAAALKAVLSWFDEILASDQLGGSVLKPHIDGCSTIESIGKRPYVDAIDGFVSEAMKQGAETVLTIGGDGIASYAAAAVIRHRSAESDPAVLGFPAGTANIGPVVIPSLAEGPAELEPARLDAIEVIVDDRVIGYAFNDMIIGNTFLGTLDGHVVNLDARSMAERGEAVIAAPCGRITAPSFYVSQNGRHVTIGHQVAQICASPLRQDRLNGRAVFGGLLQSIGFEHPAAVAFLDRIAVDSRPEKWNHKGPLTTTHICMEQGDEIELCGLEDCADIIIDGNPFIRKGGNTRIRVAGSVLKAFRPRGSK